MGDVPKFFAGLAHSENRSRSIAVALESRERSQAAVILIGWIEAPTWSFDDEPTREKSRHGETRGTIAWKRVEKSYS